MIRQSLFVLLMFAAGVGAARWGAKPNDARPLVRLSPSTIVPLRDEPRVVTDDQLIAVLQRMRPSGDMTRINDLLHSLRLWGDEAAFDDPAFWSGAEMRDVFIDDEAFRRLYGNDEPPLIKISGERVDVRPWTAWSPHEASSSAHANDVLATFAEIGLSPTHSIHARAGQVVVADLLRTAMCDYHRDQLENEWTAIAYARWMHPAPPWSNHWGRMVSVDDMVDDLLEQPLLSGVCGGTHRLEALVVLLRSDDESKSLGPWTRAKAMGRLTHVRDLLAQSQSTEGWWDKSWPSGEAPSRASNLEERILATGHHLEWLALAPKEVQLPREQIVRAAQWLAIAMHEVDDHTLAQQYGPFSHAARALCLWRGAEAWETWKRLN